MLNLYFISLAAFHLNLYFIYLAAFDLKLYFIYLAAFYIIACQEEAGLRYYLFCSMH
jgi:hypothetical protein